MNKGEHPISLSSQNTLETCRTDPPEARGDEIYDDAFSGSRRRACSTSVRKTEDDRVWGDLRGHSSRHRRRRVTCDGRTRRVSRPQRFVPELISEDDVPNDEFGEAHRHIHTHLDTQLHTHI